MEEIRTMLEKVAAGEMTVEDAVLELKKEPFTAAGFDDLGFAKLDTHRKLRQGAADDLRRRKNGGADRGDRGGHEKARAAGDPDHALG